MNFIKQKIFWFFDFLCGAQVLRNYRDVKFILENSGDSRVDRRKKEILSRLLSHVKRTVPFYESQPCFEKLNDFPIVNKNTINQNREQFFSKKFKIKSLYASTTSGSTGTPFTFYHSPSKRIRHIADTIYFLEQAGFFLGEKLCYFRPWKILNKRKNFFELFGNILREESSNLSERAEKIVSMLERDSQITALLAYASTYDGFVESIFSLGRKAVCSGVKVILSMSEAMSETTRENLEKIFNCPVVSRYSNMENGFLAQEFFEGREGYRINWASYHVELLDFEKDIPVPIGCAGRIVVTDLFNDAMPFIRYDTGDIGVMGQYGEETILVKVEGRLADFLESPHGKRISPSVISVHMQKYPELRQYQLSQVSQNEYLFKLNLKGAFLREQELLSEIKNILGADAIIKIQYVDEIPTLAARKFKRVLNNYTGKTAKQ